MASGRSEGRCTAASRNRCRPRGKADLLAGTGSEQPSHVAESGETSSRNMYKSYTQGDNGCGGNGHNQAFIAVRRRPNLLVFDVWFPVSE